MRFGFLKYFKSFWEKYVIMFVYFFKILMWKMFESWLIIVVDIVFIVVNKFISWFCIFVKVEGYYYINNSKMVCWIKFL